MLPGGSSELTWFARPALRRPILVLAFTGLFDVAEVATAAVKHLASLASPIPTAGDATTLTRVAAVDPDRFYDFTSQRPTVRIVDGSRRVIDWPANELHALAKASDAHDLVLLRGVEPHLRWQTFAGLVVEVAMAQRCELVVTLGAAPEAVPHTRRPRVVGSSTSPDLASRLALSRPTYEGPTGIIGVLLDAFDRAKLPAVSLRVPVPHYALGTTHPQAVQALLHHLQHVTAIPTHYGRLDSQVTAQRGRIDAAVAADTQIGAYVRALEERYDQVASDLPTGDDLAAELERFLRERGDDA